MALDWYVLQHLDDEVVKKEELTTPTHVIETSIQPQTEVDELFSNASYNHTNQYDEVEEF